MYNYANFNSSIFTNKFSLVHLYINRSKHKLGDFAAWLALLSYVPSVICQSETWYHDSSSPAILPNYKMHSVPGAKGMGGGVCIFVKNDISFTVLNFSNVEFVKFEYSAILIDFLEKHIVFFAVYKPPSSSVKAFIDEFASLIISLDKFFINTDLFLAGDINIDLLKNKSPDFTNLLLTHSINPKIFHATHITKISISLLYNFFSNSN